MHFDASHRNRNSAQPPEKSIELRYQSSRSAKSGQALGKHGADLVGLLVSGHHADRLDEGVPGVVHARLDGLVQRVAAGRGLIAQLGVDGGRQVAGHAVVVLAQVGVLRAAQTKETGAADLFLRAGGGRASVCHWVQD